MKYKKPRKCPGGHHAIEYSKGCWRCGYDRPGGAKCEACNRMVCTLCWIQMYPKPLGLSK